MLPTLAKWSDRLKRFWATRKYKRTQHYVLSNWHDPMFRAFFIDIAERVATECNRAVVPRPYLEDVSIIAALASTMHENYRGDHAKFLEAHAELVPYLKRLFNREFESYTQ